MKKGEPFVAEKAILKESNGTERVVYVQERGSIVSTVSKAPKSSWKTEEQFATSRLRPFDDDDDNDANYSSTNDSDSDSQYSTSHYNDEGECVGGALRSE
jgi:hypothetical protein